MLDAIRIVLVNTTHPGNIGAAARAMKTMGLRSLWLVNPRGYPSAEATARASGADDVLASARAVRDLDEALAGAGLVLGTSARLRSLDWPVLDPARAACKALEECAQHPVALLFGRERYGLTNDELKRCHYLVQIPANPDYRSLNLAASVQVLGYEIYRQAASHDSHTRRAVAGAEQMEGFFQHLEATLRAIEFLKGPSEKMMLRLRRLFNRARPDETEINILRGILSDTRRQVDLLRGQGPAHEKGALKNRESPEQDEHPHGRPGETED